MRRRALRARSLARCSAVAFSLLRFDRRRSFSLSIADRSALGATASRARAVATASSLGGVQTVDPTVSPSRLPGLLATISALSLSCRGSDDGGTRNEGENYRSGLLICARKLRRERRGFARSRGGTGGRIRVRERMRVSGVGSSPDAWAHLGRGALSV